MKRRDLTKNQQRRLNYHMKRAENKIKEIKEKCCIKEDTTLEDKYILNRKLFITVMKIIIKDLFYNFRWEFDIFLEEEEEELSHLIQELLDEREEYCHIEIPQNESSQKLLLRDLMNVREPKKIKSEFYRIQDAYLQTAIEEKGIVDVNDLKPIQEGIYLWQGDITTLKCDAIVNAANSQMTGCYIPHHRCIDNCIHSYAGMQLRYACYQIMEKQGKPEATGKAKITKAYNLPSRYILHTVGPIIYSTVTKKDEELLASCYRSCLEFAAAYRLESIAFCCISTGEFHFPKELATKIAIKTVKEYLKNETSIKKVIFNVFKDEDRGIYERYLR